MSKALPIALLSLLVLVGCAKDELASNPDMRTPSAANGPKLDEWAKQNPGNGAPGEADK